MTPEQARMLDEFAREHGMLTKGGLSLALVITRHACQCGLPLEPDTFLTPKGGQVKWLGGGAVKSILADYEISRILASEGGRTSRGNIAKMRAYVSLLNTFGQVDKDIEEWWILRVREFFARKPLRLKLDQGQSISATISELLGQAGKREAEAPGATYVGTVLQQLVAAKLDVVTQGDVQHHGSAVADEASQTGGDYVLSDVVIHVTTAPGEALIAKCQSNLESGRKPIIITLRHRVDVATGLAEQKGISSRVDVFDAEQFVAGNVYELGGFSPAGRESTVRELVAKYNQLIDEYENDPSLRIET